MSASHRDRLARRYERRFAATFRRSVERMRERITDARVRDSMEGGLAQEPLMLYYLVDRMDLAKAREEDVFAELIAESGRLELRSQGLTRLAGAFNLTSPFVLSAARGQAANLVTRVSAETKRAIRQIIFESIRDGDAPAVAARTIRQTVGLTQGHAIAVKRFAASHTEKGTARYARKLLNYRARNIARTETIRASRAGQQAAWKEMARDGLIDTSRFRQKWQTVGDDRMCFLCAPMDGALVSLGGQFESSEKGVLPSEREPYAGDTVEGPPLHPMCRCDLVADFG